jgi:RHS repeat-associated protein
MTVTDYYVTSDAMGSVTTILDADGNVLERRSYDAFGGVTCMAPDGTPVAESPTGLDVGFQGQVRDEVTGLYQMGYRWYTPVLGRWLSRDPIGLNGDDNQVRFVSNSPAKLTDANGLSPDIFYDKGKCKLTLVLKYFIELIPRNSALLFNPQTAVRNTETIFSSQFSGHKCKGNCDCPNGVTGELVLKEVPAETKNAVKVIIRIENLRSNAKGTIISLYQNEKNGWQMQNTTVPHEFGHVLGLQHPGQRLVPPLELNSPEDYVDKENSNNLMGTGDKLIKKDFDKLYCHHVPK